MQCVDIQQTRACDCVTVDNVWLFSGDGATNDQLYVTIGIAVGGSVIILVLLAVILAIVVAMVLRRRRRQNSAPKKGAKLKSERSESFVLHRMNNRVFASRSNRVPRQNEPN